MSNKRQRTAKPVLDYFPYSRHVFNARSWYRLFSHITSWPFRKLIAIRLRRQKQNRERYSYSISPKLGAVVQFFNKRQNIPMLLRGLKYGNFDEIIVLEDGSVDGSLRIWQRYLDRPNQFILRSNDLYEVITYDRALRFSQAEIVCLLQDDDQMPMNDEWVKCALRLFETYPDLLILGGHHALNILSRDETSATDTLEWVIRGEIESIKGLYRHQNVKLSSNSAADNFQFVMAVVRAPVFIRRREFLAIGGFDLSFAPFLCDDLDNCIRAWLAGYKVGVYSVDFTRDIGLGGMRAFNSSKMSSQAIRNWNLVYEKHGRAINDGSLTAMVVKANTSLKHSAVATPVTGN